MAKVIDFTTLYALAETVKRTEEEIKDSTVIAVTVQTTIPSYIQVAGVAIWEAIRESGVKIYIAATTGDERYYPFAANAIVNGVNVTACLTAEEAERIRGAEEPPKVQHRGDMSEQIHLRQDFSCDGGHRLD